MKRITLITTLLSVLLIGSAFGLTREDGSKYWLGKGFRLGLSHANLHGTDAGETLWRTGLNFGGVLRLELDRTSSLQLEVLYSRKGTHDFFWVDRNLVEGDLTLDYVEVPILWVITVPTRSNLTPNFLLGLAPGFITSSKFRSSMSDTSTETDVFGLQPYDLGLALGGGLTSQVGAGKVLLEIRYTFSMSTFDGATSHSDFRNGVISLNTGYLF